MARSRNKKHFQTLHLLAIILICGLFASIVAMSQQSRREEALGSSSLQNIDWAKLGYKLDVPSNFILVGSEPVADLVIPGGVYYQNRAIRSAEFELSPGSQKCDSFGDSVKKVEKEKINGLSFDKVFWSGTAAGNVFRGVDYNFLQDGICYQVRLFTHSEKLSGAAALANGADIPVPDMDRLLGLADSLVSSFRLVNSGQ